MFAGVRYAAQHALYVNMSWGGAEFAGETALDSTFTSTPGVSFFAASGDTPKEVTYPSASAAVISAGGTTLTLTSSTGAWKSESGWSTGGGGCSLYEAANPAQAGFPTYDQSGANCKGLRATPDISLDASPTAGVSVYDTYGAGGGWLVVGGTSLSSVLLTSRAAISGNHVDATFVYGSAINVYDVTTGFNGYRCLPGYDVCTGVGSWNTAVGVERGGTPTGTSGGSLTFTPSKVTLIAGSSSAMKVSLSVAAPATGLTVSLSSTSGGFSTSSTGPFSSNDTVAVAGGQTTSPSVYFEATKAGTTTLSASASGWSSASETDTVKAGSLVKVVVSPTSAGVPAGSKQVFTAAGYDAYGNAVAVSPTWSAPSADGTLTPAVGTSTTFTAAMTPVTFVLSATSGTVTGTASVSVTALPSMSVSVTAGSVTKAGHKYRVPLTVAVNASSPLVGASVTLRVYSGACTGSPVSTHTGTTGTNGTASFSFTTGTTGTFCATASVSMSGYRTGTGSVSFSITGTTKKVPLVTRFRPARWH